jgi:hypothetical protein
MLALAWAGPQSPFEGGRLYVSGSCISRGGGA